MHRNSTNVSTKQERIAQLAKQSPQLAFTSLAYLVDVDWLKEAYRRTRKDGAVGVDGMTAAEYEQDLEGNLRRLLDRAKSGTYQAPPVRRVHIPKGGSGTETRPIGIPTLEDKILQRAIVMLLEPIWKQTMASQGGWILDVDVRKFFDNLDHGHLRTFLRHRVRDGMLLRLIGKWLKAGVMGEGNVSYPEAGSPQGGVVSPILSNVFLHYVLDLWFEQEVQPRLRHRGFLIRFADDFVMGFRDHRDAQRVMEVLPKRFGKYGLTVHPDKTRLVPFRTPSSADTGRDMPLERPGTFDFLGFTHFWARSRKGHWIVKRKTASDRFSRAVRSIDTWCRQNRHQPIAFQQQKLSQKIRGHCAYYGVTGNWRFLQRFHHEVKGRWRKWLNRRNRERTMTWSVFDRLVQRYPLAPVRIVCSAYNTQRTRNSRNRML